MSAGGAGRDLDAAARQPLLERAVAALVGDDRQRGAVAQRQLGQRLHVAVGRQRHDLEQVRVAADEVERARADRARGAEHA